MELIAQTLQQCKLPFRTSPNARHIRSFSQSQRSRPAPLFTQTITPAESSEEEDSPPFASSPRSRTLQLSQLSTSPKSHTFEQVVDVDIAMTDSHPPVSPRYLGQASAIPSPKPSPCTTTATQPPFRDPFKDYQHQPSGGRLPTPIYGHFQQSIDARMDTGEDPENIIPRTQQEIEYEKYVRRRRLPTPIDEDEVMNSWATTENPTMGLGNLHGQFSSKYTWPTPSSTVTPPARATRLSFSMGIRADCDLCRMKVPGHSNHIFRS